MTRMLSHTARKPKQTSIWRKAIPLYRKHSRKQKRQDRGSREHENSFRIYREKEAAELAKFMRSEDWEVAKEFLQVSGHAVRLYQAQTKVDGTCSYEESVRLDYRGLVGTYRLPLSFGVDERIIKHLTPLEVVFAAHSYLGVMKNFSGTVLEYIKSKLTEYAEWVIDQQS